MGGVRCWDALGSGVGNGPRGSALVLWVGQE